MKLLLKYLKYEGKERKKKRLKKKVISIKTNGFVKLNLFKKKKKSL